MDLDDVELEAQLRETLHRAAEPVHGEGLFKETIRNEVARRQAVRSRARWTGRLVLAGAAVAAAVALFILVKPDQDQVDTDGGTGPVATEPEVTTTVDPDNADPRTGTIDDPSSTTSTTPSTTEPTTTTSTAPPLPEFPAEAPLAHGQPTWGVYLATTPEGQVDAPAFQAALQAIADAGYGEGYGSLGCDQGAVEALGGDSSTLAASAYFATEAIANQARAAFEARGQQVLGVVNVTTYCLD